MMRERAVEQKKTLQRIESPLAKYDDKNNLWCVVCNVTVQSEALWTIHLVDKSHKKVRRWKGNCDHFCFMVLFFIFRKLKN